MKRPSYKITTNRDSIIVNENKKPNVEIVDEKVEKEKRKEKLFNYVYENFIMSMKNGGYLTDKFDYKEFSVYLSFTVYKILEENNLSEAVEFIYKELITCNGFLTLEEINAIFTLYLERRGVDYD